MSSRFCPKCGTYMFSDTCNCKPFYVYHEEYLGEHDKVMYGACAESVAEAYARYFNEDGDYTMMQPGADPLQIFIATEEGGPKHPFTVWAEPAIQYHVQEGHRQ